MNLQLLCNQAIGYHQMGRLGEAEQLYLQILHADRRNFVASHLLGVLRLQQGRHGEALELIGAALKINPNSTEALSNHGNVLIALGRLKDALVSFDRAMTLGPVPAETLSNRGTILGNLRRPREALASYDAALKIKPNLIEALSGRADALRHLGRFNEAVDSCDKALAIRADYIDALNNRGAALSEMNRFEEALACYDRVLAINPKLAVVLSNRGSVLQALKRPGEALANLDKALEIEPDNVEALSNRGVALTDLRRFDDALESYDRALAIAPNFVEALRNRGHTLRNMERLKEALANYDQALLIDPDHRKTLNNCAIILSSMNRYEEALEAHERVLAMDPEFPGALGGTANAALNLCDWQRTERLKGKVEAMVAEGRPGISPFLLLGYGGDAKLQLQCALIYASEMIPGHRNALCNDGVRREDKIRIAYLSADFHDHPTAFLTAELFERHDRSRFEVVGISFGPDEPSAMRHRLINGFDSFYDVQFKSDLDVAMLLKELGVHIAIDLKGYTYNSRPEILSYRPCAVQVNYLGYPGTMGCDFIDYIIADRTVLPIEEECFFTEKVVYLPDAYQVNDTKRAVSEKAPIRADAGLPEQGFVFCSFNNSWKITAPVFDIWMRLLGAVPGSVLWLLAANPGAGRNLCREAEARGVDSKRLVFADRVEHAEHLSRHRLADLFLDTLPYTAHTTASDALWSGLPMVTCKGNSFVGRVAASLLTAIGLPELVADTLDDYEALALSLARNPQRLQSLRHRIDQNRLTMPLFDTERYTRNIEAAYRQMWDIAQRGEAPYGFGVEASV